MYFIYIGPNYGGFEHLLCQIGDAFINTKRVDSDDVATCQSGYTCSMDILVLLIMYRTRM